MNNQKKKLLFIDHEFHQHTLSSNFMLEILRQKYDIKTIFLNPDNLNLYTPCQNIRGDFFDIVVIWQIMPSILELKNNISFKNIIFFPMYDGIPALNSSLWKNYQETRIISFSKTLYKALKKRAFDVRYIQYFPEPKKITQWGNPKSVFYWQRVSNLPIQQLIFQLSSVIEKIHIHLSLDPHHYPVNINTEKKVSKSTWFDSKEELDKKILESSLYIAPRLSEGIGMSFLEAMAMGRCVIAPNFPTMNEYIKNGKTGFLYDLDKISQLKLSHVLTVQKQTLSYIQKGYYNWLKNKNNILKWMDKPVKKSKVSFLKNYYIFGKILIWRKKST